ncbi:MAG TPA: polymer-forming cytoskeletal protein [Chitinispirillaceae bacterium]|nr:polymer-forming cytoskeletal protein [Chitinispirillaceae bacterium]
MKMKLRLLIGIFLCSTVASSAMVIRNYTGKDDEYIRTESGNFDEDYLFLGNELRFSGTAQDLVFLGRRLIFSGETQLTLINLSQYLIFSGVSGNGIISAAMDIDISGTITGNSYMGCKSFVLGDSGVINGNLFIGCAEIQINGPVNGDLYVGAGEIFINDEIQGNVTAYGRRIIIGEEGRITGNLKYGTGNKLSEKELRKVGGTVTFVDSLGEKRDWRGFRNTMRSFGFFIGFGLLLSYLIIGLLLLFLPVSKKLDARQSSKAFWKTALWGLIPVLIYPAAILLSFILVITIPFAFILIFAFIPLFYTASIIGSTLIGKFLVSKFGWKIEKRHYQFLIGAIAEFILSLIPFINILFFIFISSLGWGVYTDFLFNRKQLSD